MDVFALIQMLKKPYTQQLFWKVSNPLCHMSFDNSVLGFPPGQQVAIQIHVAFAANASSFRIYLFPIFEMRILVRSRNDLEIQGWKLI